MYDLLSIPLKENVCERGLLTLFDAFSMDIMTKVLQPAGLPTCVLLY